MIDGTIESNIAFGVDKSNIESDKIEKVMSLTELDKDFKKPKISVLKPCIFFLCFSNRNY